MTGTRAGSPPTGSPPTGSAPTGSPPTGSAPTSPTPLGPVTVAPVPVAPVPTDLARRATADPLFRLVAYALEAAHGRPPAAVWSAPYAFHLGSPGLVAAAGWPVAAAAAPRTDGLVRLSSLGHPADSCDLPLTPDGPSPAAPAWAVRPQQGVRARRERPALPGLAHGGRRAGHGGARRLCDGARGGRRAHPGG